MMQHAGSLMLGAGLLALFAGFLLSHALILRAAWQKGILADIFSFSPATRFLAFNRALQAAHAMEKSTTLGAIANRVMMIGTVCAIVGGGILLTLALINLKSH
jgi:hypothetical protein